MTSCDSVETLLSGFVDRELSPNDHQRVRQHVEECHPCALKVIAMYQMKNATAHIQFRDPPREEWDECSKGLFETSSRGFGWVLYIVAAGMYLIFLVSVLWGALNDPAWEMAVVGLSFIAGTVVLFIAILSQRLKTRRTDPYKDIIR